MSPRRPRAEALRPWILAVAAAALTLLLAEGALRLLGLPRLVYTARTSLVELDPDVLYRMPGRSSPDLNSLGFRDREFGPRDPRRRRILLLGDSFVMSLHLKVENTLSRQLEARLGRGYEVLNFGVYGYGPDQEYLRLVNEGLALAPATVVLALYPDNDFNDLAKNRLFERDAAGRLRRTARNPVSEALAARPRLSMLLRRAWSGHFLPVAEEQALLAKLWGDIPDSDLMLHPDSPASHAKVDLMRALLERFRDDMAARGIGFGVTIIPSVLVIEGERQMKRFRLGGDRESIPERLALDLCRDLRLEVFDLTPGFGSIHNEHLYQQADFHLSKRGSQLASALMAPWVAGLRPAGR